MSQTSTTPAPPPLCWISCIHFCVSHVSEQFQRVPHSMISGSWSLHGQSEAMGSHDPIIADCCHCPQRHHWWVVKLALIVAVHCPSGELCCSLAQAACVTIGHDDGTVVDHKKRLLMGSRFPRPRMLTIVLCSKKWTTKFKYLF